MKTARFVLLAVLATLVLSGSASAVKIGTHFFYWYDAPYHNCDINKMPYDPPGITSQYNGTWYSSLSTAWYEWQLDDLKIAGIDYIFPVSWGERYQSEWFKQSVLYRLRDAIRNKASNIKIGLYDDTQSEACEWNADNGHGYINSTTDPNLQLSCAAGNAAWYFYDSKIKPFFQLIPRDMWATHNGLPLGNGGRPLILTYTCYYYKDLGSAASMWQAIKNAFAADFGVQPYLVLCWSWWYFCPGINYVADAECVYGGATSGIHSYTQNGYTTANLGPGSDTRLIGGTDYTPRWTNYSGGDDGLDDQWYRENFQAAGNNTSLYVVESWNELWEGTAISRCTNFPGHYGGYLSQTYYMDKTKALGREFRDRTTPPTSLQNGNFEGGFTNGVPNSWEPFWVYGDITVADETTAKHGGSHAAKIYSSWWQHLAGLMQRVSVTQGQQYQFSAWTWRHDSWNNGSENEDTYVGIDPYGGVDPTASTVVWSSPIYSYETWNQQSVTATAQSNIVTVFLRCRAIYGGGDMRAVFDDCSFSEVTPGKIQGTVKNISGTAISGATVSTTTGGYSTTTDSSGNYTLSNVVAGDYTVTSAKTGYQSQSKTTTVTAGSTATVDFTLSSSPSEKVANGNMEGGFFSTGWGTNCSGQTSKLPNSWGWNNESSYPFNTFDATSVKHGGSHSLGFAFCQTASSPGKMGIAYQSVNLGSAGATGTFTVWAYHTDGNCPSIMCWNPGQNQNNPYTAQSAGRYQWVTTDNWGQRNTWVTRSMTVTADSSGYVTIMVGGAAHPGTASGAKLYIDDVSVQ
jgi:hypothetical protein